MSWRRIAAIVVGACGALLGGLWLLQGLGLVRLRPLLCVAACRAVEGASPISSIIGGALLGVSLASLALALRPPR